MLKTNSLYFDYNASALIEPGILDFIESSSNQQLATILTSLGNPSSTHCFGRNAHHIVFEAIESIRSEFLNCSADAFNIILTSGATESNNMILKSQSFETIVVGATEHASILGVKEEGLRKIPVDPQGVIILERLEEILKEAKGKTIVSVMYANNETGVLQPFQEISQICKAYGAFFHCDCVQIFSKEKIDISLCDAVSISAHKIGGLSGIGALIYRNTLPLEPLLQGGGQQTRMRAGTENVFGAFMFSKAIEEARKIRSAKKWDQIQKMRDDLETRILKISPNSIVFSQNTKRLPNTSMITMPTLSGESQVMQFDLKGICLSAGSACSSGVIKSSHVLKAMGVDETLAKTAIRISMSPHTTPQEIDKLYQVWCSIYYTQARGNAR